MRKFLFLFAILASAAANNADTWYARGTGMVRHDTYNPDLELITSEVLVSVR